MRLGTRLLLILLPVVLLIMAGYGTWTLREREAALVATARREVHVYARAVGLAFESVLRTAPRRDVRRALNRITLNPAIYGIAIYDTTGTLLFASDLVDSTGRLDAARVRSVLTGEDSLVTERTMDGRHVYSILRSVRDARGGRIAVLEVTQLLDFIRDDLREVRESVVLITLTLLAALTLLTLVAVHRVVTRPLGRLVQATRRLGAGDLAHRVGDRAGAGELRELGASLDAMAENLETARADLLRETEHRLLLDQQLRESQKMGAIGNLAAGLAHEIAAPLNVIGGRAELLLRHEDEASPRRRSLQVIIQQIQRISTIVHNMLDFARRKEPRRRAVPLAGVLDDVVEFLEHELVRRDVHVALDLAGDALQVEADPDQLHQVFTNLVLNAAQAMDSTDGDRRLAIRARAVPATDGTAPGWVVIDVEDSGPGLTPEELARLFEPFFSTKRRGTGLGLIVARSIVEEHGGRLEVGNLDPSGARFTVRLPMSPRAEAVHA
ncbi:MAG TPA: ATP-binding protein [Gemmatimonadales bacterium]|nr:ATP-binding protein [Gemmatimonadales bacterium]